MEETPKSVVDVQRAQRLFDLVSLETYYGFNLRCVFAEMADDDPDTLTVIEQAFERAKNERSDRSTAARHAARNVGR